MCASSDTLVSNSLLEYIKTVYAPKKSPQVSEVMLKDTQLEVKTERTYVRCIRPEPERNNKAA